MSTSDQIPNLMKAVNLVVFIVFFLLALVLALNGQRILTYVSAAISTGGFISCFLARSHASVSLSRRTSTFLSITCYLGIVVTVALARVQPIGVPLLFYIVLILVTCLLSLKIVLVPRFRTLLPIAFFAVSIRASYWYAAPVLGRDAKYHLAFSRYIVKTGELIPETVSLGYYRFYPIGHILSASIEKITGLPTRASFFLALGVGSVIGVVLMSFLVPRVVSLPNLTLKRAMLLAPLYLTISPFHLGRSSILIVQTLMLLFVPIALVAFLAEDKRLIFLGSFIAFVLLITHNAPGLALVIFGGILISVRSITHYFDLPSSTGRSTINIVAAVGVGLLTYWIYIGYFQLQLARILRLFAPGGSIKSTGSSETISGISMSDPILHLSVGLLYGGTVITVIGLRYPHMVRQAKDRVSFEYFISTSLIFAGLGSILVIGFNTRIIRLVALAPIFVSPFVGYVLAKLSTRGRTGVVVSVVFILVLPSFIFLSAAGPGHSPGDSITEDRPGLYRNYLSQSEMSGGETSVEITESMTTGGYVENSLAYQRGITDQVHGVESVDVMTSGWPSECESFYIRGYYKTTFGIQPPSTSDKVLDVGDAQLLNCP